MAVICPYRASLIFCALEKSARPASVAVLICPVAVSIAPPVCVAACPACSKACLFCSTSAFRFEVACSAERSRPARIATACEYTFSFADVSALASPKSFIAEVNCCNGVAFCAAACISVTLLRKYWISAAAAFPCSPSPPTFASKESYAEPPCAIACVISFCDIPKRSCTNCQDSTLFFAVLIFAI